MSGVRCRVLGALTRVFARAARALAPRTRHLIPLLLALIPHTWNPEPAFAAIPTLSGCWIAEDLSGARGDRSATVHCTISLDNTLHKFRINVGPTEGRPGTDSSAAYASAGWWRETINVGGSGNDRYVKTQILTPAGTFYFSIEVSDTDGSTWSGELLCPVTCDDCDSGDDALFGDAGAGHSNFDCVEGENPSYTAASADEGIPVAPVAPSHTLDAVTPAADNTHDPGGDCSSLGSARSAAETAAEASDTVERILLPAGVPCSPAIQIPNLTQGRIQFVGENVGTNLMPPDGTRIDETFKPYMGWLSPDPDDPSTWRTWFTSVTTGNSHDFKGVYIGPPDHTQVSKITRTVTNVSGNTITLNSTALLANGNTVLANWAGTGITAAHGPAVVCNLSGSTIQLCSANGSSVKTLSGSWSAGGTVSLWPSQAITAHANCGDGEHCVTVPSHGIGEYAAATISGNTDADTIQISGVPSEFQIGTTKAVLIRDSSDASCNGIWTVEGTTSSTIDLSGAGLDCDNASDGTVQTIDSLIVWGTDSDAIGSYRKRAVWHFLVEDGDELRLVGSAADAGVTGGFITWEAESFPGFFAFGEGGTPPVRAIRFDQVIVGCEFPWRCESMFSLQRSDQYVFRDSLFQLDKWRRVDPVSGDWQDHVNTTGHFADLHGSGELLWLNNGFEGAINFISDTSTEQTHDHTWQQNLVFTKDTWGPFNPDFEGLGRFYNGYLYEYKACLRCSWWGDYFKGQRVRFASTAGVISLATSQPRQGDIEIAWVTVERSANGFAFNEYDDSNGGTRLRLPTRRVYIHDNLIADLSEDYLQEGGGGFRTGHCLNVWDRVEDFVFARNICHSANVSDGEVISWSDRKGQGGVFSPNLLVMNEGGLAARIGFRGGELTPGTGVWPNVPPADTTTAGAMFAGLYVRGVTPDSNSTLDGNVLVPCVNNASAAGSLSGFHTKITSTLDADTLRHDELAAKNQVSGITHDEIVGDPGSGDAVDSCLERLNTVFELGTFQAKEGYTSYTPSMATMADEQGWTANVAVAASATQATIALTTPDNDACTIDIVPVADGFFDSAGEITRQTDAGGSQSQEETFTSLTELTSYYYRAMCKEILYGIFTTGEN